MAGTSPDNVKRILWPQEDFAELVDEFVVCDCRIRFRGGFVDVQALSEGADVMAVLGDYAAALRNRLGHRLLTVEQYAALPPRSITIVGRAKRDKKRDRLQLGEVRRNLVEPRSPRLSQCYDYFQSAMDDQEHVLIHLYKMIESIEEHYDSSEAKAISALGVHPLKTLKRLADDRSANSRDQRHAPKSPGTGIPLTDAERARALEDGHSILRKFEEQLVRTKTQTDSSSVIKRVEPS